MRTIRYCWTSAFFCGVFFALAPASALEHPDLVYAFRSYTRPDPTRMILVGEIRSKTKAPELHDKESPFKGYDTRKDVVTVKVVNQEGLKPGMKLYVIDKNPFHRQYRNGLIVGEITVSSIFHSPFYGWALTGTGTLLRVREGHFVARTLESENLERAFVLKRRGDHFRAQGDEEKAIAAYQEAIAADPLLPEAHAALGSVFFSTASREFPVRSLAEFEQAWRTRANFRYREDERDYYLDFIRALGRAYDVRRLEGAREDKLVRFLDRSVEVAKAANERGGDDEIWIALAFAQLRRMQYYKPQSSPAERAMYDAATKEAGEILKKLFENPVSDPLAHRTAALYYSMRVRDLPAPAEEEKREKARKLVLYHADKYYQLGGRDPEVDALRRQLLQVK